MALLPNKNVLSAGTSEQQKRVANDPLEPEINAGAPAALVCPSEAEGCSGRSVRIAYLRFSLKSEQPVGSL